MVEERSTSENITALLAGAVPVATWPPVGPAGTPVPLSASADVMWPPPVPVEPPRLTSDGVVDSDVLDVDLSAQ